MKKIFFILALLCAMVQGAWAQTLKDISEATADRYMGLIGLYFTSVV